MSTKIRISLLVVTFVSGFILLTKFAEPEKVLTPASVVQATERAQYKKDSAPELPVVSSKSAEESANTAPVHECPSGCNHCQKQLVKQPVRAVKAETLKQVNSLNEWYGQWQNVNSENKAALLQQGVELAKLRAKSMSELIEINPDEAIKQTLPLSVYADLPKEVAQIIEKPVSEVVSVVTYPLCAGKESAGSYHKIGDQLLKCHSASNQDPLLTKTKAPVFAFRLNGKSLVVSNTLRQLDPSEMAAAGQLFQFPDGSEHVDPVSGEPSKPHLRAVLAGRILGFSDQKNLDSLESALQSAQASKSPDSMEYTIDSLRNGTGLDPIVITRQAAMMSSSWTTGDKRVLFIRVQFSDVAATSSNSWSHAASGLQSILDSDVEPAIDVNSFGKSNLISEESTGLYTVGSWSGS